MSKIEEVKEFYRGKRVLITGHTGFKGSWLAYWLWMMGAEVLGMSRYPHTNPNHSNLLGLRDKVGGVFADLRDRRFIEFRPDIVFHLAANAIVADSFKDPGETFNNNIGASVAVLDMCVHEPSVRALVMITTDKVYKDKGWRWAYRENDELGGTDPYSCSKVCIEHIIESYKANYKGGIYPLIATARAGNVIGGGDWNNGRLLPDIARAISRKEKLVIHTPNATRPWQHVLEPLYGYLLLGMELYNGNEDCADTFNFGPRGEMKVMDVIETVKDAWGDFEVEVGQTETHPGMVELLKIDSIKARKVLGWQTVLSMEEAIQSAAEWYGEYYKNGVVVTDENINHYERLRG